MAILRSSKVLLAKVWEWELDGDQEVQFDSEYETHAVFLPRQDWLDMGSPEQVTVTIEPGSVV